MDYKCSVCNQKVDGDLMVFKFHTESHIVDLVKHDHPSWVEKDGVCEKCLEYYQNEIRGSVFKDAACALRQRKIKNIWSNVVTFFSRKSKV
jgi:hypothetical protein